MRARYFWHSWNRPNFFILALYDNFKAPCHVVLVFDKCCIFWSFLGQKRPINGRTCHNLHRMSEIIHTWCGCLPWACHLLAKVGVSHEISKKNIMFNRECLGRPDGFVWEHIISRHPLNDLNFFHGLLWPIQSTMPSYLVETENLVHTKCTRLGTTTWRYRWFTKNHRF